MAVVHTAAVRTAIADLVVDLCDTNPPGYIEFQTAGDAEVATCPFAATAFGAAVAGVATAAAIVSDTSATGGTIAKARFKDGNDLEILSCSVTIGGGGGDITLSAVVIAALQTVSMTALTYTAPT
ncbi:MAG TPA: hypothetical protein VMW48_11945 [Vicinamibacterales bacterium]|nr:hypothetical protein [Vicinamibacterales bacterium]